MKFRVRRSPKQVEALWPKAAEYQFVALVTTTESSIEALASKIQRLYEDEQAMAGSFVVNGFVRQTGHNAETVKNVFQVTFSRYPHEDAEVVAKKLRFGRSLEKVLTEQFKEEIQNALQAALSDLEIKIIGGPIFCFTADNLDATTEG